MVQSQNIYLLPDDLINKIAAGEVVERPASILKELIENALDAEATEITIELEDGGRKKIIVADDGTGMSETDARMSVKRHATSKIRSLDDLFHVQSMGFRGEALASIAAVSQLIIVTAKRDAGEGIKIDFANGERIVPHPRAHGTSIICEDLFYNVPARAKFLKTPSAEFGHCLELVQNVALIRPDVSFRMMHQGKEVLFAPAVQARQDLGAIETLRKRFSQIFSKESVSERPLIPIESSSQLGTLRGLVSPPGVEKFTARHLLTYVNGRFVKDKNLRMAITRGYHSHLLKGRYPVVILDFHCDPALVDVNVHPAKTEVRFQYAADVQSMIAEAIRTGLRSEVWAKPIMSENTATPAFKAHETFARPASYEKSASFERPAPSSVFSTPIAKPKVSVQTFDNLRRTFHDINENHATPSRETVPWEELSLLGSFADCYLFFEMEAEKKLLVIDQHAFHERILYEKLMRHDTDVMDCQPLLIPEVVELSSRECDALENHRKELQENGFRFVRLNHNTLELTGIPVRLQGRDVQRILAEIAQFNGYDADEARAQAMHHLFATIACHSAVRKGDKLSGEELQRLIREASHVDFTANCPHGRPVLRWWSEEEVGRWFYRA